MSQRIQITKLRDHEPTEPDILGRTSTIVIPDEIPSIADTHRALVAMADQAPLYIAIMAAARVINPNPSKPGGLHAPTKPKPT